MIDIITANKSALSFAINAIPRVKEICKPLTEYLGIKCFGYLRIYNDCSYISLINGYQEYQQQYFTHIKSQDPHFNSHLRSSAYNQVQFFLWPTKYEALRLCCANQKIDKLPFTPNFGLASAHRNGRSDF